MYTSPFHAAEHSSLTDSLDNESADHTSLL